VAHLSRSKGVIRGNERHPPEVTKVTIMCPGGAVLFILLASTNTGQGQQRPMSAVA
jgi:hypothetical protein